MKKLYYEEAEIDIVELEDVNTGDTPLVVISDEFE